jgi:hypothetical protein
MGALLSVSLGRLLLVGAISALLASGVSVWATSVYYKADIAELRQAKAETEAQNASASLKQLTDGIARLDDASKYIAGIKFMLNGKLDGISKDLKNAQKAMPLPVDCKPDFERVRALNAAIAAANSAAATP